MTTVEIAVCYADLNVVRVPWHEKHSLPVQGVLWIIVYLPGYPVITIGHDIYQLIWTDESVCLSGHNENYTFWSFAKSHGTKRFPFAIPENYIEFAGEMVASDVWEKALAMYREMR